MCTYGVNRLVTDEAEVFGSLADVSPTDGDSSGPVGVTGAGSGVALSAAGGVEAPARPRTTGRIGESVPRPDGIPETTGSFQFSSDLWADGMLWGRALRSPHPYARIRSINIAPALAWSCEPPLIGGGPAH